MSCPLPLLAHVKAREADPSAVRWCVMGRDALHVQATTSGNGSKAWTVYVAQPRSEGMTHDGLQQVEPTELNTHSAVRVQMTPMKDGVVSVTSSVVYGPPSASTTLSRSGSGQSSGSMAATSVPCALTATESRVSATKAASGETEGE
jgi:hypothetical protein